MEKITIIGAGNVGAHAAVSAATLELGNIILLDRNADLAKGKALDITQSMALFRNDMVVTGTGDYKDTADSDIVIITAGVSRKPGMSRDDLVEINANIVVSIVEQVVVHSPNCILIVVTNPINTMVQLAYETSGFSKDRVIGMAGILDGGRFKYFIAKELSVAASEVTTMVLGDHGELMVPLEDHCQVNGQPIAELMSRERIEVIIHKVQYGGAEIVNLLKTGSAYFAPGLAVIQIVKAIIRDEHKTLPCAVYLQGEYDVDGAFVGVPVVLGRNGIEKIVEIHLSERELKAFNLSVAHIKERTEELKQKRL
ncbi:MAG: malate dehydrogenase [gamma proteobacterium symbiont of Lucinoma myriamae]|nr:malate dehydrogenase [gamma proteobacterium symbiont of Lucinoma myriamae]MCU7817392.1 malate dehydrogenase [gamma proteobacterium symbiont of Lucinoma myriamae]MCU7831245.1 malate dehydrogenase [gamma proteobacterium symbiont of Lucinoma myriamae]